MRLITSPAPRMVFPYSPAAFVAVHLCRCRNVLTRHLLGGFSGMLLFPEQIVAGEIIRDGHVERALIVFLFCCHFVLSRRSRAEGWGGFSFYRQKLAAMCLQALVMVTYIR